ncbi:MAG: type III pantothenate kinase [Acidobacteriota bacterium]
MLLVVDVGNSHTVLGVFHRERLLHSWRVTTRRETTSHEYAALIGNLFSLHRIPPEGIRGVAVCSVVPPLNEAMGELCRESFGVEPLFLEPARQSLIPVRYHRPEEVGADRVANALAAREMFGTPCVVVDFGTATTFDVISAEGEYLGGAIAPGLGIAAEALYARTARLPRIEIRPPGRCIGRTTVESMQAGLYFGYLGLVERILADTARELGTRPRVVATGGFANLLARDGAPFDSVEPHLTLHGLRIFFAAYREAGG